MAQEIHRSCSVKLKETRKTYRLPGDATWMLPVRTAIGKMNVFRLEMVILMAGYIRMSVVFGRRELTNDQRSTIRTQL